MTEFRFQKKRRGAGYSAPRGRSEFLNSVFLLLIAAVIRGDRTALHAFLFSSFSERIGIAARAARAPRFAIHLSAPRAMRRATLSGSSPYVTGVRAAPRTLPGVG